RSAHRGSATAARSSPARSRSRSTGSGSRKRGCGRTGTARSSADPAERIGQLGVGGELRGAAEVDQPLARLVDEGEEMARLPLVLGDDSLLAELREQEHVRGRAVDQARVRDAVASEPL